MVVMSRGEKIEVLLAARLTKLSWIPDGMKSAPPTPGGHVQPSLAERAWMRQSLGQRVRFTILERPCPLQERQTCTNHKPPSTLIKMLPNYLQQNSSPDGFSSARLEQTTSPPISEDPFNTPVPAPLNNVGRPPNVQPPLPPKGTGRSLSSPSGSVRNHDLPAGTPLVVDGSSPQPRTNGTDVEILPRCPANNGVAPPVPARTGRDTATRRRKAKAQDPEDEA